MTNGEFMPKGKKIAALVPNILGFSPGQRVRIELWEKYLNQAGWTVEFFPFESESLHEVLYAKKNSFIKAARILGSYQKQLSRVLNRFSSDVIFIYREASLIGPLILERLVARQNIPIVYDIDDPIFLPYKSPTNGWASLLKFSKKTHKLFRLSSQVIAINKLMGDYAATYNPNVTVVHNCVDIEKYKPNGKKNSIEKNGAQLVWIGSHSTMYNLLEIVDPIKKLQKKHKAPLLVIGAGELKVNDIDMEMRQWSAETEVQDLHRGDIGLVPVEDSEWNQWKFFYKTIQYMAVGMPVIAYKIGSNKEVIEDGINGFLVQTEKEWFEKLKLLVENPDLRIKMGQEARKTVIKNYSVETQIPRMIKVFEKAYKINVEPVTG
jgi:glycosyltransferase involved in cell wall biosynthesis